MTPLPSVTDRCPELRVTVRGAEGRVWQARDAQAAAAVALVESERGEARWLKRRERRQAWIVHGDGLAVFVKRVRFKDAGAILRSTLRAGGTWLAYKGALHEAERTLAAEARLRRVARLHALGERRRVGLIVEETLVFEALLEHETLLDRLTACGDDAELRRAALERALDLFHELCRARLAHLDLNPRNVMLHGDDPRQDCVVDIEQMVEIDRPRPDLFAHALGMLYTDLEPLVPREEFHAVALPALARALELRELPDDVLRAYDWFLGRSLPRRQRLRLARRGLGGVAWMQRRIERRAANPPQTALP